MEGLVKILRFNAHDMSYAVSVTQSSIACGYGFTDCVPTGSTRNGNDTRKTDDTGDDGPLDKRRSTLD